MRHSRPHRRLFHHTWHRPRLDPGEPPITQPRRTCSHRRHVEPASRKPARARPRTGPPTCPDGNRGPHLTTSSHLSIDANLAISGRNVAPERDDQMPLGPGPAELTTSDSAEKSASLVSYTDADVANHNLMSKSSRKKPNRRASGYCNICNEYRELTRDHVPPKGSIRLQPVETRSLVQWMTEWAPGRVEKLGDNSLWERDTRRRLAQSGVNFRSICAACNNVRLGARYDPELNSVSQTVSSVVKMHLTKRLALPSEVAINVRTHYLMRAIVGHLLAAHRSKDQSKPPQGFSEGFYADLRSYFLDENLPLPDGVKVYYWPYLSQDQVLIKSLGVSLKDGTRAVVGDLIKFFPMAYYVTKTLSDPLDLPVKSFYGDGCNNMECEITLHVRLDSIPPPKWPETPGPDHNVITVLGQAVVSSASTRPRRVQHPSHGTKQV